MTAATPLKFYNLARMYVTSVGTGTATLGAAVPGFLTFAQAGVQDQDELCIAFQDGANSEIGTGVYTASGTTLTRVPDASTNSGSPINLSGTAQVMILSRAQDLVPEAKWNGGRLTLTSNTPVLTANTTAQTVIFWTPYLHDHLTLPDVNGNWTAVHAAQGSVTTGVATGLAISLDTTNFLSGKLYDIFGCISGGVPRLGYGPAWTNNTTRSAAISRAEGVWTNTASITLRFDSTHTVAVNAGNAVLLGTAIGTANGQTGMSFIPTAAAGGTANILGLANVYNTVPVIAVNQDNTASYTYGTVTWRVVNGNSNNSISYIDSLGAITVRAGFNTNQTSSTTGMSFGINRNSTSATPPYGTAQGNGAISLSTAPFTFGMFLPLLGYNTIYAMEISGSVTASTMSPVGVETTSFQNEALTLEVWL
jgi:hypothetical protein